MKIVKIEDGTFSKDQKVESLQFSWGYSSSYDGYILTLEDGSMVQLGICNGQSCCEDWGYLMSEDDLSEFVGAEYFGVEVTDTKLAHVEMRDMYEGSCMFVNIKTSNGVLQFVAYNEHNGYYGHEAIVIVDGTTEHSETL